MFRAPGEVSGAGWRQALPCPALGVRYFLGVVAGVVALLLFTFGTATAQGQEPLNIYCVGNDRALLTAIELTSLTRRVDRLDAADVAVISDLDQPTARFDAIRSFVLSGGGLVLFAGEGLETSALTALGMPSVTVERRNDAATLRSTEHLPAQLSSINWKSAPRVRRGVAISGDGGMPLVEAYERPGEALLVHARVGEGKVFLVTPSVADEEGNAFVMWPYFNYLVYALAVTAAGRDPLNYADYPGSPVPHGPLQMAVALIVVIMVAGTLAVFTAVRRYSRRHPEVLRQVVRDTHQFRIMEGTSEWENVGFHRGIASFMLGILNNVWLFVPVAIMLNAVLFGLVVQSAQVRGSMSLVVTFFGAIWTFMDWGTALAGQKFLSQYRVREPAEGMKYVQLFVWWQAITGTFQVATIAIVAIFVLPHTAVAYISLYVLLHALIQFPGFLTLFQGVALPGLHRFDYPLLINTIMALVTPVLQVLCCAAAIEWGRHHPVYDSIAGGLGLGVAALLSMLAAFCLGFHFYRRLGLSARVLFMAHFDRKTLREALGFGFPVMLTGIFYTGAYSIQVWLLARLVYNYTEVQANFDAVCSVGLTGSLVFPFTAVATMSNALINSYSEAFAQRKIRLCQYYLTMTLKWGYVLCLFLMAVQLAVGDRFILGALGEQYALAAVWSRWFAIWGFFTAAVFCGDSALLGIGRPGQQFIAMLVEQGLRITLMFVLAERFQAWALVYAYMIALPFKALIDMLFLRRHFGGIVVNWWQTLIAPLLAAAAICVVLRWMGGLFWMPTRTSSSSLLLVGLVLACPPYFWLTGLLGAWDDQGLREFRRAVPISNIAKPLAWLLLKCVENGAAFSPLHNRFATRTYDTATQEAAELTSAKVRLDDYSRGVDTLPVATLSETENQELSKDSYSLRSRMK